MVTMRLDHLRQGYQFNGINVIDMKEEKKNKSGTISFSEEIAAAYFIEDESVSMLKIFANTITNHVEMESQLKHTILLLNILINSIYLLGNITKEEATCVLKMLNMFNGNIVKKSYKYINCEYICEIVEGMFVFTIITTPPAKSEAK